MINSSPLVVLRSGAPVVAVELYGPGAFPVSIHEQPECGNPAEAYLRRLGAGSRPTMEDALNTIARWLGAPDGSAKQFPWWMLRYEHTSRIRAKLLDAVERSVRLPSGTRAVPDDEAPVYRPATANKMLAAMRGVLKEAWRLELLENDEYMRAVDVQAISGSTSGSGEAASKADLQALLDLAEQDGSLPTLRNVAAIMLGYNLGLRVAELVALDVADYNPSTHRVRISSGKGRKAASLVVTPRFRAIVAAYLEARGAEPGPMFGPVTKKGELLRRSGVRRGRDSKGDAGNSLARLTERGFTRILKECCARAGVRHLRPHDLRRSMITHLLDRTGDLAAAQRRARHASATTTTRYDRREQKKDDEFAAALDRTLTAERELGID